MSFEKITHAKKLYLVTTAIEETWPNEPDIRVLFLGEWCKLYSRKGKWQIFESGVLTYHWDDRLKLFKDYNYIKDLYERLLKELVEILNEIHHVEHSIRYWRILLGPWLGYFVQIVFDRWCMVEKALQEGGNFSTIVLTGNEADLVPNDMKDFNKLYISDDWNHFIYSKILRCNSKVDIIERSRIVRQDNVREEVRSSFKLILKGFLLAVYSKFIKIINGENSLLFIDAYLTWKDHLKLALKYWQVPVISNFLRPEILAPDFDKRRWMFFCEGTNPFEKFVKSIIPLQIPVAYLEGYLSLVDRVNETNWPIKPRLIFTSNSYEADDLFKVYAAIQTQRNIPFVIGQHGGLYGLGKWFFSEEHEIAISDRFFSWGWSDELQQKLYQ